ncbi:baseplate wedge subunit [uncultured Caudovirales phage]|uniref:Baseplate wedge subunit n=1 Tax=uncultured Caudovirales phage TaxID=2100421 RepID=A0A6J5M8Y8_9CAUD|nr:baseplate wedge subunit [uncultured Caudovirales phage]
MAIDLGNVQVIDLSENSHTILGIAINTSPKTGGAFQPNYTTLQQAKSNLVNLILTKKGERVAQPDFGCDIWRILFEPIINGEIDARVESTILDAVSTWLPYISIDEILLDYSPELIDSYGFNVEIRFSLASNPNLNESVTINVNP